MVAYTRPAFSATKRTNHAPISSDQNAQVSQGHTPYRIKGISKYRGSWLWRPRADATGAQASIQPSKALCIPERVPRILPVCRSLLALIGRKQAVVRHYFFLSETFRFAPCLLVSRRGFSCPTPRRPGHLPFPEQIWRSITGSSPLSRFPRWYASSGSITVCTNGLVC